MSWIDTSYEIAMKSYFVEKLDITKGNALYNKYESIRNSMVDDNFFKEIKGKEPDLSDHSERHIQDVFERTYKVIGEEEFKSFNIYEIYCLAIMVLFHDVGNIRGRKNHQVQEKIAEATDDQMHAYIQFGQTLEHQQSIKRVQALAKVELGWLREASQKDAGRGFSMENTTRRIVELESSIAKMETMASQQVGKVNEQIQQVNKVQDEKEIELENEV